MLRTNTVDVAFLGPPVMRFGQIGPARLYPAIDIDVVLTIDIEKSNLQAHRKPQRFTLCMRQMDPVQLGHGTKEFAASALTGSSRASALRMNVSSTCLVYTCSMIYITNGRMA